MFSIPHLIIVFLVALVVFGPEKLPELARNVGKIMNEFKKATGDLRSTFEGHLRDLEREADSRRMDRESSVAASASSVVSSSTEPSPALPTPGTVPATPPRTLVEPTSQESVSSSPDSPSDYHPPQNGSATAAATAEPPSELEPEHNPETLTDAGNHPA